MDVISFCNRIESYMGILGKDLTKKVTKDYNKYFDVYSLIHHSNAGLIKIRALGLIQKCKCLTPDNINDLLTISIGKIEFPKEELYPVLPIDNIDSVMEAFDLIKGYYSDRRLLDEYSRREILLNLKLDFYADWHKMVNMSEDESIKFWVDKIKALINIEPNSQNRVTMKNVIIRRFPNLEAYETYLLE